MSLLLHFNNKNKVLSLIWFLSRLPFHIRGVQSDLNFRWINGFSVLKITRPPSGHWGKCSAYRSFLSRAGKLYKKHTEKKPRMFLFVLNLLFMTNMKTSFCILQTWCCSSLGSQSSDGGLVHRLSWWTLNHLHHLHALLLPAPTGSQLKGLKPTGADTQQ